jgi:hypothetical protein
LLHTKFEVAQKELAAVGVRTTTVRFSEASRKGVEEKYHSLCADRCGYNRRMEKRFGSTAPYTIGVEEEFQLVDPSSRELAPVIEAVLDAAPSASERMAPELFQDCVEMRTPAFSTVAELTRDLSTLRSEVAKAANKAGVRLSASGLHPISDPFSQRFTPGERY